MRPFGQKIYYRKFREQVKQQSDNKLIVFDDDRYAIFETCEVFIHLDRPALPVTLRISHLPSLTAILARLCHCSTLLRLCRSSYSEYPVKAIDN